MELKDLVVLANAGFSKDEILGFAGQNPQVNTPVENPQVNTPVQNPHSNDAILDAINKLTASIQASNVQATGNTPVHSRTEQDVMNDLMAIMN